MTNQKPLFELLTNQRPCLVMTGEIKRTESSEETESTTTASRRDSEDSDSGVNLSEREKEAVEGEPGEVVKKGRRR